MSGRNLRGRAAATPSNASTRTTPARDEAASNVGDAINENSESQGTGSEHEEATDEDSESQHSADGEDDHVHEDQQDTAAHKGERRKHNEINRLNEAWGTENAWVPPYSRFKDRQLIPLTSESMSTTEISRMLSITTKAIRKGIALPSLFSAGGYIDEAVKSYNKDGGLTWH